MGSMQKVDIYISGQCFPNPGPGSWAATLYYQNDQRIISGQLEHVTNTETELHAAIESLKALKHECAVTLYSCNQAFAYVANGRWTSFKNADLWTELRTLEAQHEVHWIWTQLARTPRLMEVRHLAIKHLNAEPDYE
jgi:ribonuclease HI